MKFNTGGGGGDDSDDSSSADDKANDGRRSNTYFPIITLYEITTYPQITIQVNLIRIILRFHHRVFLVNLNDNLNIHLPICILAMLEDEEGEMIVGMIDRLT